MRSLASILFATIVFLCSGRCEAEPSGACENEGDGDRMIQHRLDSRAMQKQMRYVVKLPANTNPDGLSVVYVLHGHGGDECDLLAATRNLATKYGIVIVQPSMEGDGGWFDSPIDPSRQYETMVIRELLPDVEGRYGVASERSHRAITGFSMGGQGALLYAAEYPDLFLVAGSVSGILDIRLHRGKWGMDNMLGPPTDRQVYERFSITASYAERFARIQNRMPLHLQIEAGRQDFAYADAILFTRRLDALGVSYESELEHDGAHGMAYMIERMDGHLGRIVQALRRLRADN